MRKGRSRLGGKISERWPRYRRPLRGARLLCHRSEFIAISIMRVKWRRPEAEGENDGLGRASSELGQAAVDGRTESHRGTDPQKMPWR